jgi:hypothetical protein
LPVSETDDHKTFLSGMSDDQLALLVLRMIRIVEDASERIGEYRQRFFERHSVLPGYSGRTSSTAGCRFDTHASACDASPGYCFSNPRSSIAAIWRLRFILGCPSIGRQQSCLVAASPESLDSLSSRALIHILSSGKMSRT